MKHEKGLTITEEGDTVTIKYYKESNGSMLEFRIHKELFNLIEDHIILENECKRKKQSL